MTGGIGHRDEILDIHLLANASIGVDPREARRAAVAVCDYAIRHDLGGDQIQDLFDMLGIG